ncbi:uncharacterized protein IWZ02DRAFT_316592 [Phyllosticta citriasiana]|uniref:uncharacterized protein n=1 Tax=Phyllosticta citriasiana TaxID=595635 RepID=UPI0030FD2DFF
MPVFGRSDDEARLTASLYVCRRTEGRAAACCLACLLLAACCLLPALVPSADCLPGWLSSMIFFFFFFPMVCGRARCTTRKPRLSFRRASSGRRRTRPLLPLPALPCLARSVYPSVCLSGRRSICLGQPPTSPFPPHPALRSRRRIHVPLYVCMRVSLAVYLPACYDDFFRPPHARHRRRNATQRRVAHTANTAVAGKWMRAQQRVCDMRKIVGLTNRGLRFLSLAALADLVLRAESCLM